LAATIKAVVDALATGGGRRRPLVEGIVRSASEAGSPSRGMGDVFGALSRQSP
jgi:hypothetical protein